MAPFSEQCGSDYYCRRWTMVVMCYVLCVCCSERSRCSEHSACSHGSKVHAVTTNVLSSRFNCTGPAHCLQSFYFYASSDSLFLANRPLPTHKFSFKSERKTCCGRTDGRTDIVDSRVDLITCVTAYLYSCVYELMRV